MPLLAYTSSVESSQVESSQVEFSLVESKMVERDTVKLRICFCCVKDSDSIRLDWNLFDSCARRLRKREYRKMG